ncbi:probable LRR receptor-like serine/threonine-protein kinase rlk [Phtheirospermum japonicum]|uniref:Probable LRR receptor-like serine/threonine-protein kinase rlk n=1 Tax=Phtheirospermum japonicum TaxID=374723 RepID=A0A830B2N7_9LAMI|nr:probable LRR receptor-like serine/threonine-protein kinase rlk [Phtheirospermum japonicum]
MPTGAQAAADVLVVRPPLRTFLITPPFFNHNKYYYSSSSSSIFIFILVVSFCLSLGAVQDHNEAQPLLHFKNFLQQNNNNISNQLADWNPSTPPCSGNKGNWAGVLCYNGNVFGLKLENMNLKGPLDIDSLMPLHSLRALSFMDNNLEGPIPDWRKIGALKSVYLSNNRFSGQILEDAFRGMYSLKKVHMANNNLTGHIPTSLESPKLIELRLENNHFTGSIPLISSEHLILLNVSNNQLVGPIPAPLSKMNPTSFADTSCPMDPNKLRKIVIIVIAVIVVAVIIALLLVCIRRRGGSQAPQLGREVTPAADIEDAGSNVAAVGADNNDSVSGSSSGKTRKSQQKQQQSTSAAGKLSFVREDRQRFELQDLMRASAEVLGSGNFGASYKAVLVDGEALVVKRFKQMNIIAKEDFFEHMRRLGRLKHANLLPLVAYLYRKEEKLLVFDYAHNGSLAAQLHGKSITGKPQGLSWATRLKIIKGVGKGLVYLQRELPSLTLCHGHLKSSNVLLDKDFNPLLMDYALAPVVNANNVHQILIAYKSPEFAKHGLISKKTDVWCFGILILETLTGKYVAHGTEQVDLTGYINAIVGEQESGKVFDKDMEISCRSEMEKLLQIAITCCQEDPEKRLDLEETVRQIEQLQDSAAN